MLTECDEFKTLDYQTIYDSMMKPAFLFDGRNILDHAALRWARGRVGGQQALVQAAVPLAAVQAA